MSIKIAIDNNFLDNFIAIKDNSLKEKILRLFQKKYFSFYPNVELLSEVIGLIRTKRVELLPIYADILLKISHHRILNVWNRILLDELGIFNDGIFVSSDMVRRCKLILSDLARGNIKHTDVQIAAFEVEQEKDERFKKYLKNQRKHFVDEKNFRNELKKKGLRLSKPKDFEEFYQLDSSKNFRFNLLKDIFEKADRKITDLGINKILNNPGKYPYFHTMMRGNISLVYRHIVLREKVDSGDDYDFRQIIYLADLDYLISNDKRIYQIAHDVFPSCTKILKFEDFLKMVSES